MNFGGGALPFGLNAVLAQLSYGRGHQLGMKPIVRQVKDLIEAAEPDVTVMQADGSDEPFACPVGVALWEEYLKGNPDGLQTPPANFMDYTDPELRAYAEHVNSCVDCKDLIAHGERPD